MGVGDEIFTKIDGKLTPEQIDSVVSSIRRRLEDGSAILHFEYREPEWALRSDFSANRGFAPRVWRDNLIISVEARMESEWS